MPEYYNPKNNIFHYQKEDFDSQAEFEKYRHENYNLVSRYDQRWLTGFDNMFGFYKSQYPESNFTKSNFHEYVENGYFPELYMDHGEQGFMVDTPHRIDFINKVINKWGYNKEELRFLLSGENFYLFKVLPSIITADCSNYKSDQFMIDQNKKLIATQKLLVPLEKSIPISIEQIESVIKKFEDKIGFLESMRFANRSLKEQKQINDDAEKSQSYLERKCSLQILLYREIVLFGFHPFTEFSTSLIHSTKINDDKILSQCQYEGCFPELGLYAYWGGINIQNHIENLRSFIPTDQLFYSTPDFYVGYSDDEVVFKIRNPAKVTSAYMKDVVNRVYTKFRSSLNVKRMEWGSKTGAKEQIIKRNEILKKLYAKIQKRSPSLTADEAMHKTIQKIGPEFGYMSLPRAKRVCFLQPKNDPFLQCKFDPSWLKKYCP